MYVRTSIYVTVGSWWGLTRRHLVCWGRNCSIWGDRIGRTPRRVCGDWNRLLLKSKFSRMPLHNVGRMSAWREVATSSYWVRWVAQSWADVLWSPKTAWLYTCAWSRSSWIAWPKGCACINLVKRQAKKWLWTRARFTALWLGYWQLHVWCAHSLECRGLRFELKVRWFQLFTWQLTWSLFCLNGQQQWLLFCANCLWLFIVFIDFVRCRNGPQFRELWFTILYAHPWHHRLVFPMSLDYLLAVGAAQLRKLSSGVATEPRSPCFSELYCFDCLGSVRLSELHQNDSVIWRSFVRMGSVKRRNGSRRLFNAPALLVGPGTGTPNSSGKPPAMCLHHSVRVMDFITNQSFGKLESKRAVGWS